MAAHLRIRLLLAVAVAVICGGVFVVTEVQRRSDAVSFEQYAAIKELRNAAMQMALAGREAIEHGEEANEAVEAAERRVALTVAEISGQRESSPQDQRILVDGQVDAITALAGLHEEEEGDEHGLEERGDVLLERFLEGNDELLALLAADREGARRDAARRPVLLVLTLFVFFGALHVLLVERPAGRSRRSRQAQQEFGEAMQAARWESEAHDLLARHVKRVADAVHVTVLNRNNSADRLEAVTPVRPESPAEAGLDGAAPDSCLAVRMARTHQTTPGGEPLLSCDICGASAEQTTCVPSLVGGEVVGAVLVEHEGQLARDRRETIEHSVTEAAPVVASLRNLAIAQLRAATDGLTGLPNQRTVHETLKRAAAQAGRNCSPLALVLFDLDHFKAINDTYGHGKGDDVLAAVGAVATATLRAGDFAGRLGGEEFAAVLPDTDREGALKVAEKLREAIASIAVPGVERRITASFGVAVMPDDAGEPDLLLRIADRALYAAKNAGRDRVETVERAPASAA